MQLANANALKTTPDGKPYFESRWSAWNTKGTADPTTYVSIDPGDIDPSSSVGGITTGTIGVTTGGTSGDWWIQPYEGATTGASPTFIIGDRGDGQRVAKIGDTVIRPDSEGRWPWELSPDPWYPAVPGDQVPWGPSPWGPSPLERFRKYPMGLRKHLVVPYSNPVPSTSPSIEDLQKLIKEINGGVSLLGAEPARQKEAAPVSPEGPRRRVRPRRSVDE